MYLQSTRPVRRLQGLSHLLIAVGLALTLAVSLCSPILAHEGHHDSRGSENERPAAGPRPQTRLEFMLEDLPATEPHLVRGADQAAGESRVLTIGGTAAHQRSQVVRSAPSGPEVTTTSDAWQHIPDLHTSIDTPANASLAIAVSAEAHTSGDGRMFVRALVDGQPANPSDVVFARGEFSGTKSFSFVISNLPNGTHTVSLQWKVEAGHTAYMGDRSLAVSASPDSAERGALAVVGAPGGQRDSTVNQAWQPAPRLSTTIATAAGADLAITLSAEPETSNNGRMFVRALVDGQPANPSDVVFAAGSFSGTRAFTFTVEDLPAGSHTVEIQWLIDASATGYLGDRTLVVAASPLSTARNALAVQTAPSGPEITTTSTGWQQIPIMEASIETPANSDLAISLTAESYVSGSGRMFVRALVDGQPAAPSDAVLARGGYSGTGAFTFTIEDLPAGSHAIQLQWLVDDGHTGYLGDLTLVATAGQRERQHLWTGVGNLQTNVTPAVEGIENAGAGAIYIVAVTTAGQVRFTTTDAPTVIAEWQAVASDLAADPDTDPVLIRNEGQLHLFVRGADGNLYVSRAALGQSWSAWTQLTADASVQGAFSIALSRSETGVLETHVLYRGASGSLRYRRFVNDARDGSDQIWTDALQGQIGSDGESSVMAVILLNDRRGQVHSLSRPWTVDWQHEMTIAPSGPDGGLYDMSNIVIFAGAYHVGLAVKELADDVSTSYRHAIKHVELPVDDFQSSRFHEVARYTPAGDRHALTRLVLYRNKLMAAFTAPDGHVHQARWDTADPALPWVGLSIVDASRTAGGRPDLGVFNMRAFNNSASPEYGISNYGYDAIAVMAGNPSGTVNLVNFSRAVFIREIDAQLALYHANAGVKGQGNPDSPTPVRDPSQDGRPFLSELGYALWTLPYWLADGAYGARAQLACQDGSNTSGRFEPPCDDLKYPVIIRKGGGIFIASGIWQAQIDDYIRIWEELGHTTAGTMGLADDGQGGPPEQINADLVHGIPLDALTEAYDLFGERTGSRPKSGGQAPDGRYRGFTGKSNNYDAGSRQHSFIYVVYYYVSDGDHLRGLVDDDLEAGDDLLQRKYDWVRTHIYRGVEFQMHNEPLTD